MLSTLCKSKGSDSACYSEHQSDTDSGFDGPETDVFVRGPCCDVVHVWMELDAFDVCDVAG